MSATDRSTLFTPFLAVLLLTVSQSASGQSNEELNGALQFNFHTPGARSLGIGRAFTGRADDATAAYANPAGLLWIKDPEISFEGRNTSFTTVHIDGGRANGAPTGVGIDTVDQPVFSETERDTTGLSFLSYVHPLNERWRLALYRHELANFEAAVDRSEGIFFELPRERAGRVDHGRVVPVQAEMELHVFHLGASAAYRFSERLWVGLGLSAYTFDLESVWEGFVHQPSPPNSPSFDPAVFTPETSGGTRIHTGDADALAGIIGLMWRTLDDRWALGLVYRQGPDFDFSVERYRRAPGDALCGQLTSPPEVPCGTLTVPERKGRFDVPDVYSAGVTFRPAPTWIVSAEYDRITYSDLAPSLNVLTIAEGEGVDLSEFEIEDGDEYHLGVEHVRHWRRSEIYLRLGSWYDPEHQLRWVDRPPLSTTVADGVTKPTNDAVRLQVRFPGGEDEFHYTGGAGISFGRYRIDGAADLSDRGDVYSLTGVVRF